MFAKLLKKRDITKYRAVFLLHGICNGTKLVRPLTDYTNRTNLH